MDTEVAEGEVEDPPCPRDLLRRLAGTRCSDDRLPSSSDSATGEMDLCLGLSLGGRFAAERGDKLLLRSSSIASFTIFPTEKDFPPPAAPLARTCSLPVEADEENRKRKELQSLKRLEAKRKREEKRNFTRPGADGEVSVGVPPRSGGGRPVFSPAKLAGMKNSGSNCDAGASRGPGMPESGNNLSLPSPKPLRSLGSLGEEDEDAMKKMMNEGTESNIMEEMPCVSTRGDGPNGRRIEGFLYRYKRGEEVSIVCVCHGSFLSPAEFIRHAGGGDVDHPLRHIVVNPSPPSGYYNIEKS